MEIFNHRKKGTLYIGTVSKCEPFCDINWLIVRSAKSIPKGFKQVKELSPSPELFRTFLFWKNNGQWPDKFPEYEIKFKKEMEKEEFKKKLKILKGCLVLGKDVQLICYCKEIDFCHRKIIAEYFSQCGFDVVF